MCAYLETKSGSGVCLVERSILCTLVLPTNNRSIPCQDSYFFEETKSLLGTGKSLLRTGKSLFRKLIRL